MGTKGKALAAMSVLSLLLFVGASLGHTPAVAQTPPSLEMRAHPDRFPIYTDQSDRVRYIHVDISQVDVVNKVESCSGTMTAVRNGATQLMSYTVQEFATLVSVSESEEVNTVFSFMGNCTYTDGSTGVLQSNKMTVKWVENKPLGDLEGFINDLYGGKRTAVLLPSIILAVVLLLLTKHPIPTMIGFFLPMTVISLVVGVSAVVWVLIIGGGLAGGFALLSFQGKI